MAVTFVTGQYVASGTGTAFATTLVLTLPNNPTLGNTVCLGFFWYPGGAGSVAITSILDASGNAYTVTPNSPETANPGPSFLAYLTNAPSNASKVITVLFGTSIGASGATAGWAE